MWIFVVICVLITSSECRPQMPGMLRSPVFEDCGELVTTPRFSVEGMDIEGCNDYICQLMRGSEVPIAVTFTWISGDARLLRNQSFLIVKANERTVRTYPESCLDLICAEALGNSRYRMTFVVYITESTPKAAGYLYLKSINALGYIQMCLKVPISVI